MSLITPEDLKKYLELNGVDESKLEDLTVLQELIDAKKNEIIALTGLPVNPITRKEFRRYFKGEIYETNWYPISEICEFKIDGNVLTSDDYILDDTKGIIFFNQYWMGFLRIEYIHEVSDEFISSKINPLLSDMVLYFMNGGDNFNGNISSIKEMDTSINYDTSSSLGSRIYSRIDALKTEYSYSARVRWL